MPRWSAFVIACVFAFASTARAEENLAKVIVGSWSIQQYFNDKPNGKPKSLVLTKAGKYTWTLLGSKREGDYELKGSDLYLKEGSGAIVWANLKIEGDKIVRVYAGTIREVWTRVEEK